MITLVIVLVVLVAIALVPVGVRAQYDAQGISLRVMAGALGITLYPGTKKQPGARKLARQQHRAMKKKAKPKKVPKAPNKKKAKKKLGFDELKSLLALGQNVLGDLRRKLIVRNLRLRVCFGGDDAARSAIQYGQAWAVIGAVMPTLETLFHIENRDVAAEFDPTKAQMELSAQLDLRMRIGAMLALGLKAGVRFVKILIKQKKGGAAT